MPSPTWTARHEYRNPRRRGPHRADLDAAREFVDRATITAAEAIGGDLAGWPTIDRLTVNVSDVLTVMQLRYIRDTLGVTDDDGNHWPLSEDMAAVVREAALDAVDRHNSDVDDDPRSDWSTVARRNAGLARTVLAALDAAEAR